MVRSFPDIAAQRKTYTKAYKYCASKVEIAKKWLDWEKLFGDASSIFAADQATGIVEEQEVEP